MGIGEQFEFEKTGRIDPECGCLFSDAWRCAKQHGLIGRVACDCHCHRRGEEITPNERGSDGKICMEIPS